MRARVLDRCLGSRRHGVDPLPKFDAELFQLHARVVDRTLQSCRITAHLFAKIHQAGLSLGLRHRQARHLHFQPRHGLSGARAVDEHRRQRKKGGGRGNETGDHAADFVRQKLR